MGRKTKVALTVGAAGVAAWAASQGSRKTDTARREKSVRLQ